MGIKDPATTDPATTDPATTDPATTGRPDWLAPALDYAARWLDFQMRQSETPGMVFAAADAGGLVAERAFGLADLATGAPATAAHRFRLASHSKSFTAAGVMLLREAGRLGLDDPVGRHVAGLDPAVGAATLSQLLSHSAGLARDGADAGHWQDRRPCPDAAELRADLSRPPRIDAGERFKYSNIGYGLLGLAIEAVTGEPFGDWISAHVVAPAGLATVTPDVPAEGMEMMPPMAMGHGARLPLGRRFPIPGRSPARAFAAASGFTGTAGDLARFMASLDPNAPASLLSPASRREMTRRHWRIPQAAERHYGLGVMSGTAHGRAWFGHSGAVQGFISRAVCLPEWGLALAVVTNAIDGPAHAWVDGVVGILHRFAAGGAPRAALSGWTGRWWTMWGAVDLVPVGGRVLVASPGAFAPFDDASEIEVSGPDRGRVAWASGMTSHGEPVRLDRGPDGAATALRIGGGCMLPEAEAVAEIEARLAGRADASE